ncbi:PREDICTED: relA-associated inhibitor-like [Nanorana parkeri]|uniref:relA-associated inhibitor-like n=1 Tax=Nanorana parkeri TaxID=125878 RepID=UPI00085480C1|nr:PREDICTED: relA-associated inhibitor-like [Nanorana parkeri]
MTAPPTVTSSSTIPVLSLTSSPNVTRRSLPSDNSDPYLSNPPRSPRGRPSSPRGGPSSPRPQYYDRPVSTSSSRLSSGSYDYTMGTRSASPVPEAQLPMPRYTDWTPPQRHPSTYEMPPGFAPPRFSGDEARCFPAHYARMERVSLGAVPLVKAWRESSLDPAPMKGKVSPGDIVSSAGATRRMCETLSAPRPARPPASVPGMPGPPTAPAASPPAPEEVPRPLSPTRLQPHLPPQMADVQRVLEDIPRPLRRRGSQEQTSQAPLLPSDRRQYRQIMGRLFGRAAPKASPEQPKGEEKLQGSAHKGSSAQEEPPGEEAFKIPEEPRPEEKREAAAPKPAEDPAYIFLETSESRVGATAALQAEAELPVPVVVSGGQPLELRSALKGQTSPCKPRPRRARLDPLILLLDGALSGEVDVVSQALREVNDPSQPNEEGITALHNAICGANFHIVTLLINSGANVNAADSHGWTPLHCAASCNDLQICTALVRHGAAIFATTFSDGSLPVEKCDPYREGYKECLTYLTEVGECMGETQSGVVYALWDYSAEFADELSVREGDSVTVLRKDGEGGTWWWAALCGREGYVPRNYFGMYPRLRPQRSPL